MLIVEATREKEMKMKILNFVVVVVVVREEGVYDREEEGKREEDKTAKEKRCKQWKEAEMKFKSFKIYLMRRRCSTNIYVNF
jgi:hypothetical protein